MLTHSSSEMYSLHQDPKPRTRSAHTMHEGQMSEGVPRFLRARGRRERNRVSGITGDREGSYSPGQPGYSCTCRDIIFFPLGPDGPYLLMHRSYAPRRATDGCRPEQLCRSYCAIFSVATIISSDAGSSTLAFTPGSQTHQEDRSRGIVSSTQSGKRVHCNWPL